MSGPDSVPFNFLGIPAETSSYDAARVVVLPIGFEATTSYGTGTRGGPEALIAASRKVESYDPDLGVDLAEAPIHTADPVAPDLSSPGAMTERIARVAAERWDVPPEAIRFEEGELRAGSHAASIAQAVEWPAESVEHPAQHGRGRVFAVATPGD